MGYPRFRRARAHKFLRADTGADLSTSSTNWADLASVTGGPGAGGYDLTLEAQVGDVLQWHLSGMASNAATSLCLDAATIVSAAPVNSFSGTSVAGSATFGLTGIQAPSGVIALINGVAWLTVAAGDVSGGLVTVRPFSRVTSAVAKLLYKGGGNNVFIALKNLGPVDPN